MTQTLTTSVLLDADSSIKTQKQDKTLEAALTLASLIKTTEATRRSAQNKSHLNVNEHVFSCNIIESQTVLKRKIRAEIIPEIVLSGSKPMRDTSKQQSLNISTFAVRLMKVVSDPFLSDIICWVPDGHAFIIRDVLNFPEKILKNSFPETKTMAGFMRKLHRWGFTLISMKGQEHVYFHQFFDRENPSHCMRIVCQASPRAHKSENILLKSKDGFSSGTEQQLKKSVNGGESILSCKNLDMLTQKSITDYQSRQLRSTFPPKIDSSEMDRVFTSFRERHQIVIATAIEALVRSVHGGK